MADTVDIEVPAPEPEAPRPRKRTVALWGVLVVLALGAGALVVTSADDDPPKLPVALGAAGAGGAESKMAAPAADMAMMAWIRYVAGDDLPLLGGDGPAYRMGGGVDEGRVRDLADALGIDGKVTRGEVGWTVDDGDGKHLEVYEGMGGSWWYTPEFMTDPATGGGVAGSSGSSAGSAGTDGITEEEAKRLDEEAAAAVTATTLAVPPEQAACPPDAKCAVPDAEPFTPPADLPTKAEAREIALDLFRDAGMDVDDAKVTVDGPYEAWYVNVEHRVDGRLVSGLTSTASIGSKGEITSASGSLGRPEKLGDYPVLDTRKAIDRLNTQYGGYETFAAEGEAVVGEEEPTTTVLVDEGTTTDGSTSVASVPPSDMPCIAAATDVAPTTVPAEGADASPDAGVSTGGSTDPVGDPVPAPSCVPPGPPAEPMEVVLHEAEEILVMVPSYDDDQVAYLVPGYRFTGDDGNVAEVAAVDDDSLLPQPTDEPAGRPTAKDDAGTTGSGAIEPAIVPEPAEAPTP